MSISSSHFAERWFSHEAVEPPIKTSLDNNGTIKGVARKHFQEHGLLQEYYLRERKWEIAQENVITIPLHWSSMVLECGLARFIGSCNQTFVIVRIQNSWSYVQYLRKVSKLKEHNHTRFCNDVRTSFPCVTCYSTLYNCIFLSPSHL